MRWRTSRRPSRRRGIDRRMVLWHPSRSRHRNSRVRRVPIPSRASGGRIGLKSTASALTPTRWLNERSGAIGAAGARRDSGLSVVGEAWVTDPGSVLSPGRARGWDGVDTGVRLALRLPALSGHCRSLCPQAIPPDGFRSLCSRTTFIPGRSLDHFSRQPRHASPGRNPGMSPARYRLAQSPF